MPLEIDTPPQDNTFRRVLWLTVSGLTVMRAYWSRRLIGAAIGLMSDTLAEATTQAFYARLPGHPEQADDSMRQSGLDRDLVRFRGESRAAYALRQQQAWDDYEQGGSPQIILKVIDKWGAAGWPATWVNGLVTLVESGSPTDWSFTLTIPFGLINPPWTPWLLGDGSILGQVGLFLGIGPSTDIPMLLYLVRKWKRTASRAHVNVYYDVAAFITFTV